MKVRNVLPLIIAAGLLIAACQARAPAELTAEDEAAIRGIFDTVLTTVRAADWAGWTAVFSEDGVLHPPNGPAVSGREALQQWAEAAPAPGTIDFQDVRVWGAGNLAYGTSGYTMTTTGSPADTGKQLAVFQRDPSGKWQVVAVSFNSDLPIPASGEPAATPTN